jgi:hypothetical protein
MARSFPAVFALLPLACAAACLPQPPKSDAAAAAKIDPEKPQPRSATYNCAGGGTMTIQNLGTSVRVLGPDGVEEELPASPAGQNSRYGAAHDAIVIDGRDALVMKGGATPLTCTR